MKLKFIKNTLKYYILAAAIILISTGSYFRLLDYVELEALDLRFWLRPKIATSDKIVYIEIGEDSIKKIGRFPFDRNYHAMAAKALSEAGASAVLFDFLFSEPQEHDKEFEFAINQAGNVYLPYAFDIGKVKSRETLSAHGYIANVLDPLAKETKGIGHINIVPDMDGKFRRIPIFINYEETLYPHLSFVMACDYLKAPLKNVTFVPGKYITYGQSSRIPLDDNSNMIVNFSGKWNASYKHYSYIDVLQSYFAKQAGQRPILDLGDFKDKICIIGLTATGAGDVHPNPFEPMYPGMGIHAEAINSIINKNFISRASRPANIAILLFLSFFISIITFMTKPLKSFFILLLTISLFTVFSIFLFGFFGIWIDVVYPISVMALLYLAFTLGKYVIEWKNRLVFENELDIAKKIQLDFLPKKIPALADMEVAAEMIAARQVGGDLYHFVKFQDERIGIMIGDVSGKGIPASLFMSMVTGAFKFFIKLFEHPKEVLAKLNSNLVEESSSNLFVTMLYSIFDFKNRTLTFANGGHLPLLHVSRDGGVKFLDSTDGMPLGLMEGPYSEDSIEFKSGDVFVFYTDGVTEAMDARSNMYGKERLLAVVEKNKPHDAGFLLDAIKKDVRKFEPKSIQHDDITIIVIKIK